MAIIETIADPDGLNGNAAFVTLIDGQAIIHEFEAASQTIRIPAFGGFTGPAEALVPANAKYRRWLQAIALRTGLDLGASVYYRDRIVIEAAGVGSLFRALPVGGASTVPLLRASGLPGGEVTLRDHNGGLFPFAAAWRWVKATERFLQATAS